MTPPMNVWSVWYTSPRFTPCFSTLSRSTSANTCGTLGMKVVLTAAISGRLRAASMNFCVLLGQERDVLAGAVFENERTRRPRCRRRGWRAAGRRRLAPRATRPVRRLTSLENGQEFFLGLFRSSHGVERHEEKRVVGGIHACSAG